MPKTKAAAPAKPKADVHYHVVVDYDGIVATTDAPTWTAALDKARSELLLERMFDSALKPSLRRRFRRPEFINLVYAKWTGSSRHPKADPSITIEVSACTSGVHAVATAAEPAS